MDEQQKIELYEKALYIVKNAAKKGSIYFRLEKKGLDIFYTEWNDLLSVYFNLPMNSDPVLSAKKDRIIHVADGQDKTAWIDAINREFKILMQKNSDG